LTNTWNISCRGEGEKKKEEEEEEEEEEEVHSRGTIQFFSN